MVKKSTSKFIRGFIDPLSLIAIGFLLITTVVGVSVVKNREISLNPNKQAANDCLGAGEVVAQGTPKCCSGLIETGCVAQGSFSYCKCANPPTVTTPTPSTRECTVRTCNGNSCNSRAEIVAYANACPSSNCVNDGDCGNTAPTQTPTPIPSPSSTPMAVSTPLSCVNEGGTVANGTGPCCDNLVKTDCMSAGSFSSCKCSKPITPTPTPLTKDCTVRNCSGASCVAVNTTVPYSQVCSPSNCVSDTDCECKGICLTGPSSCSSAGRKTAAGLCGGVSICCSNEVIDTTCDGKPDGTTECTNTGISFNQCKEGKWTNYPCTNGYICPAGGNKCIQKPVSQTPTPTEQPQAGNMFSGWNSQTPYVSEEYTQGTTACLNNPESQECKNWNTQLLKEGAIAATLFLGPYALPGATAINGLGQAAYAYGSTYLSSLPSWVGPSLTIAGTFPGLYSATKCNLYPAYCTADDRMNMFLTGVGIQQLTEQLLTQNIAAYKKPVFQTPATSTTTNENILVLQMEGKMPSSTADSLAQKAAKLMQDEGLDQYAAISKAVNLNTQYYNGLGNSVPADAAKSLEQSICLPGQCRNISQISTATARNMGVEADFSTFKIQNTTTGQTSGHAVTPFINSKGTYGIIDATNNVAFDTVDKYIEWMSNGSWIPTTNIVGGMSGATIYQIP